MVVEAAGLHPRPLGDVAEAGAVALLAEHLRRGVEDPALVRSDFVTRSTPRPIMPSGPHGTRASPRAGQRPGSNLSSKTCRSRDRSGAPWISGLSGRVAIVTGGASNIGRAISHELAGEGAIVAILDRDEAMAERTAEGDRGRRRSGRHVRRRPHRPRGDAVGGRRRRRRPRPDRRARQQRRLERQGRRSSSTSRPSAGTRRTGSTCTRRSTPPGPCCRGWSSAGPGRSCRSPAMPGSASSAWATTGR